MSWKYKNFHALEYSQCTVGQNANLAGTNSKANLLHQCTLKMCSQAVLIIMVRCDAVFSRLPSFFITEDDLKSAKLSTAVTPKRLIGIR